MSCGVKEIETVLTVKRVNMHIVTMVTAFCLSFRHFIVNRLDCTHTHAHAHTFTSTYYHIMYVQFSRGSSLKASRHLSFVVVLMCRVDTNIVVGRRCCLRRSIWYWRVCVCVSVFDSYDGKKPDAFAFSFIWEWHFSGMERENSLSDKFAHREGESERDIHKQTETYTYTRCMRR